MKHHSEHSHEHSHHGYHHLKIGHLPSSKLKKLMKTHKLSLTAEELSGNTHNLWLHPESHKHAHNAKMKGKGVHLHMSHHELHHNIEHGGSLWDSIKNGAKVVGNFLSNHGTDILNGIEGAANAIFPEAAPYTSAARQVARAVTGKGIKHTKEELKQLRIHNLIKAREAKKNKHLHGGSFLQAGM